MDCAARLRVVYRGADSQLHDAGGGDRTRPGHRRDHLRDRHDLAPAQLDRRRRRPEHRQLLDPRRS